MAAVRFDRYVEECLYDPQSGFYAAGRGAAGHRRGDFITSPEVGPLFGAVLARAIDFWWDELGQPEHLRVIDVGSGPGSLVRSIRSAEPRCRGALELIEVDPVIGVELPDDLSGAIVVANELLDNLPFRVVQGVDGRWLDVFVTEEGWEELRYDGAVLPGDVVDGGRAPVLETAAEWVSEARRRGAARILVFDYGVASTAELIARGGWLRTYRSHQRGTDPYREPGEWDITTDIAVDQLPHPDRIENQAGFLRRHGIEELVTEGADYWTANAARPDLRAVRMRSRTTEAPALLDPNGLGGWLCLTWKRP